MEAAILDLKMQKAMFMEICGMYNEKNKKQCAKIEAENKRTLDQVNKVIDKTDLKYHPELGKKR